MASGQLARPDCIPDPRVPIVQTVAISHCTKQRRRRSELLANTRQMVEQNGFSGVELRLVAEKSDVSIQTVYNLVGNRRALIAEAITEYISVEGQLALKNFLYPDCVIALTDTFAVGALMYPDYTRQATLTYFPPDRPLFDSIDQCANALTRQALRQMAADGLLRSDEVNSSAARIASMISIQMLNGLGVHGCEIGLRRELVETAAHMLMPMVTDSHARRLQQWVETLDEIINQESLVSNLPRAAII